MDTAFVDTASPLTLRLRAGGTVTASKVGDHVGVLAPDDEVLYAVVRGQVVVVALLVAA